MELYAYEGALTAVVRQNPRPALSLAAVTFLRRRSCEGQPYRFQPAACDNFSVPMYPPHPNRNGGFSVKSCIAILSAALLLGLWATATQAPPEDGWVSLFNGKDLTGWKKMARRSGSSSRELSFAKARPINAAT